MKNNTSEIRSNLKSIVCRPSMGRIGHDRVDISGIPGVDDQSLSNIRARGNKRNKTIYRNESFTQDLIMCYL